MRRFRIVGPRGAKIMFLCFRKVERTEKASFVLALINSSFRSEVFESTSALYMLSIDP